MEGHLSYEEYVARLLNEIEASIKKAEREAKKKRGPQGDRPESSPNVDAPDRMVVTSEMGRS
jgi:hypothetical protein